MQVFNSFGKYGLLAKLFHWITFIILILQIPFGFYLVGLEFSDRRIDLENIHIIIGITVFYITLFRLIWKFFNPSATDGNSFFKGQIFIAKVNHFLLYLSILTITISGILKKLYMGERLNFLFFEYGFNQDNFLLADTFYEVHIYANYLLIALVTLHIFAVIIHHVVFKDKILNKIT
ncbi:cytochrome b/b6 domain-containing protein [Pelagibacteraceae bacterium]|nr:cytochrome b/b6 domain-containing protein [Pelagibacteraceae bacterium]|tara:strand:- start:129 stop:659 length:531 start_codon:yes stop_codon:yes gene_type:complete